MGLACPRDSPATGTAGGRKEDWSMTLDDAALVVIDVQNGFCPGGALEVPDGDAVVPIIRCALATLRESDSHSERRTPT